VYSEPSSEGHDFGEDIDLTNVWGEIL